MDTEPKPLFVYEVRTIHNHFAGQQIHEIVPVCGEQPDDLPRYFVILSINHSQTGQPIMQARVPFDAEDIVAAFEMLPTISEREMPKMMAELKRQQLLANSNQAQQALAGGLKLRG